MAEFATTSAAALGRARRGLRDGGALGALVLLVVLNAVFTRDFLTLQTFNVNVSQVAQIVVVAMGMAIVVATGGIDLSVGAVAAVAGTLVAVLVDPAWGWPTPLACAAALVVAAALGALNGGLITRFGVQPIVATLVLFIAGRGFAELLTGSNLKGLPADALGALRGNALGVPAQGLVAVVVVAAAAALMRATLFGRWILATGGNERAARLAGVPAARVKLAAYMLCAALAGVTGLMNVALISAADPAKIGLNIELDAIAAVAVGGTLLSGGRARMIGTVVGALVIQLMRYTLLAHGVPEEYALLMNAGVIVLAVWVQRGER